MINIIVTYNYFIQNVIIKFIYLSNVFYNFFFEFIEGGERESDP